MHKFFPQLNSLLRLIRPRRRSREAFGRLFDDFREVLDRNNKSLEVITEMGDTLSGDYLFDIQYVKRSSEALFAAVGESLNSFDTLTQNRYSKLHYRVNEIRSQILQGIDQTSPGVADLVLFYDKISIDMTAGVGGKNSNLAHLKSTLNLAVPDGFAITTRAFEAFMRHNSISEKVFPREEGIFSESTLFEVREQIIHGSMPPELAAALAKAIRKLKSRCGSACSIAVRSSAGEEDGDLSFAGQFETVLNVPLEQSAVEKAYRKVLASLYSDKASVYQTRMGYDMRDMKMAVACVAMVDSVASGVMYTAEPEGKRDTIVINSAWGLGSTTVDGEADVDLFRVRKDEPFVVTEARTGSKETMAIMAQNGVERVSTGNDKRSQPSLTNGQIQELARLALRIEQHFKKPQDIEWALDPVGKIWILQSRPLNLPEDRSSSTKTPSDSPGSRMIAVNTGIAVQKGAAAGPVFLVRNEGDLASVPRGAVLVARHDSSHFVRVMTNVSAIITDTGTPTSHMATLCREFRIPTAVNAGNAMEVLSHGQEVTVHVDAEGATIYEGVATQLVDSVQGDSLKLQELYEFRKKRFLLRYIAPLNLVDPLRDEFTPEACRTMHDILRFIHEKSVAELIESAEHGVSAGAVKLDLSIPAGIMVIDIGGGLDNPEGRKQVRSQQILSLPLRAIVAGMTRPGVWRSDAVPLRMNDFMASMLRVPDITTESGGRVETNMAVISREYANISLKFGYHFIILDCYCSENTRNNHIYFRFAGGATDMTKRSRRLQLLAAILGQYGFNIKTKGDLIVARIANIEQREAEKLLDQIGRLFSFTRQLDALLNDDCAVERYARFFLNGNYELTESCAPGTN